MSFTKDKSNEPSTSAALRLLQALAQGSSSEPLPEAEALSLSRIRLAPGETLFEAEVAQPYVYVVERGLLKLHYLLADGEEWIKSFSQTGMFLGSLSALEPGGRSSFAVTALEASVVERIDFRQLEALAARHPAWLWALYRAMQRLAVLKEERERVLLTLTPPQRYAEFLREDASLAERIPLKDLARYLGITPVSLSRIRARART
ncbi:Crp/Fnr family transcriptional regulator [Paucibacter sp. AS339]|uniref:Crp/Fnr family transcriptional regulator n=1 Tax=Paucibacter hankyongi TaxID=3133434 RepID=UPI00309D048C